MINLGQREFYIKMMIDGEAYDPFSAETLFVHPPAHESHREKIVEASRRKFTVHIEEAKKLILKEEATISRSADEKAIIEGKAKIVGGENDENKAEAKEEAKGGDEKPLI